jgi:hypothetical protein
MRPSATRRLVRQFTRRGGCFGISSPGSGSVPCNLSRISRAFSGSARSARLFIMRTPFRCPSPSAIKASRSWLMEIFSSAQPREPVPLCVPEGEVETGSSHTSLNFHYELLCRKHSQTKACHSRVAEMPVISDDGVGSSSKSAFDKHVILRIVEERPETELGNDLLCPEANSIQHDIDIGCRKPRHIPKDFIPFQDILIFEDDRGRGGKCDLCRNHTAQYEP